MKGMPVTPRQGQVWPPPAANGLVVTRTSTRRLKAVKDSEPFQGETAKLGRANARELAGVDAGDVFGLAHRQFAVIECADDRGGQDGFELFHIGPGVTQVTEGIAAASDKFFVYPSTIALASWSVSMDMLITLATRAGLKVELNLAA